MPSLLQMGDRMSSAFGIENRCPYLDKRIIEFGFSLPPEYKINNLLLKIPLRDLLRKKGILKPLNMEKKGLIFNFKSWYNENDLFREKYFKIIFNKWKNAYLNFAVSTDSYSFFGRIFVVMYASDSVNRP
jgi:asparagine synthase (glutamine-hydrolysing)